MSSLTCRMIRRMRQGDRVGVAQQPMFPALDLWLALLAGDRVWIDEGERPDVRARASGALEVLSLAYTVLLVWIVVVDRRQIVQEPATLYGAAIAATIVAAVVAVDPLGVALGRMGSPGTFGWRVAWRGAAFLVLLVAVAVVLPGWRAVAALPLGVVAGADVCLTVWALGIQLRPTFWWRRFLLSPIHLGVLGALTAMLLVRSSNDTTWQIIGLYAAMQLGVVVAGVTMAVQDRLSTALIDEETAQRDDVIDAERRQRVHWLHDDVLSEIRLTTLRVQAGDGHRDTVAAELQDLDHRLRLRQLDELLDGGSARLADILQPHVRRAQALGVEITDVPSLDAAGRVVDVPTGRLFARAVSMLLSNAINAGASRIAIRMHVDDCTVLLEVTDDAGGFDFDARPAGRGLDQLATELGDGHVTRIPVDGGSTMQVRLPLGTTTVRTDRNAHGTTPRG